MFLSEKGDGKVLKKILHAGNVKENIGEAVEQEEKICDEVKTVREFTYLGDRVSAGGACDAVVISRTRCWSAKFRVWWDTVW